jgi:hypothetical protein|tara:strand:+ start:718 stop:954 length:237 start_codon:yes stop_codon:yes gene_type:complete
MELYKPVKSSRKNKKYMVKTNKGIVHFGDNRYQQYRDKIGVYKHLDHNDKKRRELYYKRHGRVSVKDSPKYFSHKYLW